MSRTKIYIYALLACGVILGGIIALSHSQKQPRANGYPLDFWVECLADSTYTNKVLAKASITEIGTNAIPYLVQWFDYEKSRKLRRAFLNLDMIFNGQLVNKLPRGVIRALGSSELHFYGSIEAFAVLGEKASAAVPEIAKHLESSRKSYAASILAKMGKDGLSVLLHTLRNSTNYDLNVSITFAIRDSRVAESNAIPVFTQWLTEKDWDTVWKAYTFFDHSQQFEVTMAAFTNEIRSANPNLRAATISDPHHAYLLRSLIRIQPSITNDLLADPAWFVRRNASNAIFQLNLEDSVGTPSP